ncbi:MAG: sensor histidine kinase [Candidatus Eiseniibacteriota bacterium]
MDLRHARFWTWYALAWAPFLAIIILAFVASGQDPLLWVLLGALINTAPAAVLGVPLVRLCRRLRWTPDSPGRFFAVHAALALAWGVVVAGIESALFVALGSWRNGSLHFDAFVPAIALWQLLIAVIVYCAIAGVTYTTEIQSRLRAEEERSARARALQAEAELTALRAQLNPHFLFNTLHTLLALVREDAARAEKALEQFGDLLRYSLRVQRETRDEGPLSEEWKFVRDYLALEQLRLGDRLRLRIDVRAEALDCVVPVFCLQPLVENAVRHGIAPQARGGTLAIGARLDEGYVELRVEDDGMGADAEAVRSSAGMGLRLVRQRIEALYGDRGEMVVDGRVPGAGFAVRLRIPARRWE